MKKKLKLIETYRSDLDNSYFDFSKAKEDSVIRKDYMYTYKSVINSSLILKYQSVRNSERLVLVGFDNIDTAKSIDIFKCFNSLAIPRLQLKLNDQVHNLENYLREDLQRLKYLKSLSL